MIAPDALRQHVETDLLDYALLRYIDDAYEAIEQRYGIRTGITKTFDAGGEYLFLDPPADTVTEVTEDDVVLVEGEDEDFVSRWDGRALRRIGSEWGETTVVWEAGDDARIDRVVIDLCKLAIHYEGLEESGEGDYSETHLAYQEEREAILSELRAWTPFA